ncbi:MAG: RluA family pseudouridine synthase [Clostridia bacterium]|nr:RluA family pseudouridine synthase [Clostridia bacterium]
MQKDWAKNKEKAGTRDRVNASKNAKRGTHVCVHGKNKAENVERVNGASVYTAIFKVNRSDELMEFLLRKCGTSRNNVKSLLVRKQVLVNGSVVTQYNFPLAKDDEVKLSRKPVKDGVVATRPTNAKGPARFPLRSNITILYEDEDFLVINKPQGLLSVESDKETECAYRYALSYLQAEGKNVRPYILHRIDKETSGVLVFAKNIKVHSMLKMHWNEQVTAREYFAVVDGIFEEKQGTITSYLKENKNNIVYSTNDPSGQKAVTHFEVMKEGKAYSLLKVNIDSGRKNQIRVHMQSIGHPVVGDDKYGKTAEGTQVKNPLSRLGLHASKLEFIHPVSKELLSFNAPLPPSFREMFGK